MVSSKLEGCLPEMLTGRMHVAYVLSFFVTSFLMYQYTEKVSHKDYNVECVAYESVLSNSGGHAAPRQPYSESIYKTIRRPTRTVMIGNVAVGSEHPIRVQTMTTTDTKDVKATVDQVRSTGDSLRHAQLH
jgi:hypothetical protein